YGGVTTVTLVPGDGIGQEVCASVKDIFNAAKVPVQFEQYDISGYKQDDALLKQATDSLRRNKVGLKGILYTPTERYGHTSLNVTFRRDFDIFASLSQIKSLDGVKSRYPNIDFYIIRENTEGEYSGLEHNPVPGVIESLKIVTREKTERIARYAFDFALKNGRKKVTAIHKANIMKLSDGLFLKVCTEVAERYKSHGIKFEGMIVDNASMQMVAKPQQFDVVLTGNLYGNILSNIGAALVGGPGITPGTNIGREYAVFEPGCRHVAKDIEGKKVANPTAMIESAVWMLRHLQENEHADRIQKALYTVISDGKLKTRDIGGSASTEEFTRGVIASL
ncbi:hypothetical protein M427DRAFT_81527, partial [Gonapodya prolifera JEL478]